MCCYDSGVTKAALVGTGVTPTGTISLSSGATALSTGTLDGSGNFLFTGVQLPGTLAAGASQNLTLTYNGDANYLPAKYSAISQVVNP